MPTAIRLVPLTIALALLAGLQAGSLPFPTSEGVGPPDFGAKRIPSTTPFPNYEISYETLDYVASIATSPTRLLTEVERQELGAVEYNTTEYELKLRELEEIAEKRRDEWVSGASNLTEPLFALLNDLYDVSAGTMDDIPKALHTISLRPDLTEEQFQSIKQHVLELLNRPASTTHYGTWTKQQQVDNSFLQGALEVLARHPEADTEDILLRALDRPNDRTVNRFAADALAIIGSERGLQRVTELWQSESPGSAWHTVWKVHLDRIAAAVASKKEAKRSSSPPLAIASISNGKTGKEPTQKPALPPLAEVRGSALAWVGGVVAFALIAMAWLWVRFRRK